MHNYQDLIKIFKECFFLEYNTLLVRGTSEPIYIPAGEGQPHSGIYFAHGYYASALHECAHWLVAGPERRKLEDFGYWYEPDGRSAAQQELFQKMEIKPQAIEWILSKAAGAPFRVSLDNLNGSEHDTETFKLAVYDQVKLYCEKGLHQRAERFRQALSKFYGSNPVLDLNDFDIKYI